MKEIISFHFILIRCQIFKDFKWVKITLLVVRNDKDKAPNLNSLYSIIIKINRVVSIYSMRTNHYWRIVIVDLNALN